MRKIAPFVLTVAASMLLTATIVQAAASGDPEAATASTSRVLTRDLSLNSCGSSPNNAAEWSRFARCVNANFAKVERWATALDRCLKRATVSQRPDDAYMDAVGAATVQAPGLVPGGGGANPRTLLEWKPTCN